MAVAALVDIGRRADFQHTCRDMDLADGVLHNAMQCFLFLFSRGCAPAGEVPGQVRRYLWPVPVQVLIDAQLDDSAHQQLTLVAADSS